MVYYAMTNAQAENFKNRDEYFGEYGISNEIWNEDAHNMMGKKKADLVVEGARLGENLGVDEIHVFNITAVTKSKVEVNKVLKTIKHEHPQYITQQYWYVYKENGKWFFKMNKGCKTSHEITL